MAIKQAHTSEYTYMDIPQKVKLQSVRIGLQSVATMCGQYHKKPLFSRIDYIVPMLYLCDSNYINLISTMKRNVIYYTIVFGMLLFGFGMSSCSKDEGPSGELRKVRYEAVGNIGVSTEFQFTPTMEKPGYQDFDYDEYTEVSTLPWKKEVFHHPTQEGGFSTTIEDAIPG